MAHASHRIAADRLKAVRAVQWGWGRRAKYALLPNLLNLGLLLEWQLAEALMPVPAACLTRVAEWVSGRLTALAQQRAASVCR